MTDDMLDYGRLIDDAMHDVVKKAIQRVQFHGLQGDHHFFITFRTNAAGVMISDELHQRYPEEMTIVMQHQYWDLEVEEDRFSIVLSFDNIKQNLTIPFQALISFADPSVRFGLQFHQHIASDTLPTTVSPAERAKRNLQRDPLPPQENVLSHDVHHGVGGDNVVTLDAFRKKSKK